jgi:NADPH:quinone reductase-like Zn-dependent oxidoreductase
MGVMAKVGPDVSAFKEGQHVTSLGWLATSQGSVAITCKHAAAGTLHTSNCMSFILSDNCFISTCLTAAGMGVVSKVGPGVTSFKEGQRVTSLGWLTTSQGSVATTCNMQLQQPCTHLTVCRIYVVTTVAFQLV